MKIYLAGPDVFLPDAPAMGRRKAALCEAYGFTGLFPLDNEVDLSSPDASLQIYRGNEAMMRDADAIIANLTPFRGPSADAGTVFELGFMAGLNKLCLAYSNDPASYATKVRNELGEAQALTDRNDLSIEDFGLPDNLMMIHALELYGSPLVTPQTAASDLWYDLECFEACLKLAKQHIEKA